MIDGIVGLAVQSAASDAAEWPRGFGYMVAAYVAVWVILMAYFWLLAKRTRSLSDRLDALSEQDAVTSARR
jgi:CcmD family protein